MYVYFCSFQIKGVDSQQNQSEISPNEEMSPSEQKDQDLQSGRQQGMAWLSNLDLNDNYNNKLSSASTVSGSNQSQTPSSPPSPAAEGCGGPRIERKLSIEIKKVPLQEGPRSFDTSSSVGVVGGVSSSSAGGGGVLQRSHAFKARAGQFLLTSSSSLSEDSSTEGGAAGCGESEGGAPVRPNHLPVTCEREEAPGGQRAEAKTGLAAWQRSCNSPDVQIPKISSSSSSSHLSSSSSSSSSSSTPVRTALSFTNPLHSDNSDAEEDGEMASGQEGFHTTVSTATAVVSASLNHGDQLPKRKVLSMSIAGRRSPSPPTAAASMSVSCFCFKSTHGRVEAHSHGHTCAYLHTSSMFALRGMQI